MRVAGGRNAPLAHYGLLKHLVKAFKRVPDPTGCPQPLNDVRLPINSGVLLCIVQRLQIGFFKPALCRGDGGGAVTCNHRTDITVGAVLRSKPTLYLAKKGGQVNNNRVGAGVSAIDVPSLV